MTADISRLMEIREETLKALRSLEGTIWKEVQGELHSPYKEIPTWILLYEDSDVNDAHERFKEIVSPFITEIGDFNFTVSYEVFIGSKEIHIDFLNDNNEIMQGYSVGELGSAPSEQERADQTIFRSHDSRRD